MATITTINASDYQDESRSVINDNFSALNTDKAELSGDTFTGQLDFSGTDHAGLKVNSLTTAQRDALTPANGMVIYNSTTGGVEIYQNSSWSLFSADPTGSIKLWTTTTAPNGYLICDGSAISRATYSNLFSVLSTTYGVGDGSTTFNIPNLKGKVPVGYNSAETEFDSMGETGGAKTHTLTEAQLPAHQHGLVDLNGSGGSYAGWNKNTGGGAPTTFSKTGGTGSNAYMQDAGSGDAHNNLQPYITLNYIIKY